tara:strand:- start:7460 stop:8350 length:891 start_codon:yes stop_codon:yes gene_type:complete
MNNKIEKRLSGYFALIGSAFSFSLMTVCVKHLQGRIPVSEIIFSRALISLVITRLMLKREGINPWGKDKKLLIVRGCLGTSALFCIFKALELLPIAHATIIQYCYPTFSAISAWIFLKESLRKRIFIAVILGWIGIYLVVQPQWINSQSYELHLNSVLIAICGALLTALAYTCVRKLSKNEHSLVIVHYFPLISLPLTLPIVISKGVIPIGIEWLWLIGIGLATQIGQVWITTGLKILPTAEASSVNYTQVFFATLWGIIIFDELINEYVAIGGIIILGATLISVSTKTRNSLKLN